ncbi:MAG: hypothetical protein ACK5KM_13675 [Hyphomicrobiaceae bacterium]
MANWKTALAALAVATVAATSAQAADLAAYRGHSVTLKDANGVAYYTVDKSGYRVVVALAESDSKAVRFEAVLSSPGQSVVISAPGTRGQAPERIEISRQDDRVVLRQGAVTN